jgi:hypothetical protein
VLDEKAAVSGEGCCANCSWKGQVADSFFASRGEETSSLASEHAKLSVNTGAISRFTADHFMRIC